MAYALYKSNERAKLSSVVMLVALLAPALSPAIGGVFVENLSWCWVFVVSLPLAIIAFVLAGFWLKADRPVQLSDPLDFVGLISGCAALTSFESSDRCGETVARTCLFGQREVRTNSWTFRS
ncbi:MFS transporter [Klebsiella sp. T2.Ur]|nr:MFS transporter [Klebsiella sp. T2.Ur]